MLPGWFWEAIRIINIAWRQPREFKYHARRFGVLLNSVLPGTVWPQVGMVQTRQEGRTARVETIAERPTANTELWQSTTTRVRQGSRSTTWAAECAFRGAKGHR